MRTAELRDRVVAVLVEHFVEELFGSGDASRFVARGRYSLANLVRELVEEEAPKRLGRSRVARKERALDGLGQVGEREYVPVEIREVGSQARPLGGGESLGD